MDKRGFSLPEQCPNCPEICKFIDEFGMAMDAMAEAVRLKKNDEQMIDTDISVYDIPEFTRRYGHDYRRRVQIRLDEAKLLCPGSPEHGTMCNFPGSVKLEDL